MILDWCNSDMPVRVQDRIAAILLECGGAMTRDTLLRLLSHCVQRSRIDEVLSNMRKIRFLDTIFVEGHKCIYVLSADGISYAKLLTNTSSRVRTAHARVSHCMASTAVLMRCVDEYGYSGWVWHGALEAADQLVMFRQRHGLSATEIKRNRPSPSALVRTPDDQIWWLQVELLMSSRMVLEACRHYIASLDTLNESVRKVLFVAPTLERAEWLRLRAKIDDPRVVIRVCSMDQVVEVLSDAKVSSY